MAYTKTITDANTYFGTDNHVKTYDWTSYETAERTASLAQAQRELEVYLNREISMAGVDKGDLFPQYASRNGEGIIPDKVNNTVYPSQGFVMLTKAVETGARSCRVVSR